MTEKENKDSIRHFDSRAENWSMLYQRASFMDRRELFIGLAKKWFEDKSQVLDYGCGSGVLSFELARNGFEVVAVDASPGMISRARTESASGSYITPTFECIDPHAWFDEPREFENIVCSSVIEYVEDDQAFMRQLSDIIKPGGLMLISVPNAASLIGRLQDGLLRIRSILGTQDGEKDVSYANKRYTKHDMSAISNNAGLDIVEVTHFEIPKLNSWCIPLSRNYLVGVMTLFVLKKIG